MSSLFTEVLTDPEGLGYSTMTAEEVVASIKTKNRSRDILIMSASKVVNAINEDEWNALTDAQRQEIWNVLHIGDLNPHGVEARIFISVFGAASETITALKLLRVEMISRETEENLGDVKVGHVQEGRR